MWASGGSHCSGDVEPCHILRKPVCELVPNIRKGQVSDGCSRRIVASEVSYSCLIFFGARLIVILSGAMSLFISPSFLFSPKYFHSFHLSYAPLCHPLLDWPSNTPSICRPDIVFLCITISHNPTHSLLLEAIAVISSPNLLHASLHSLSHLFLVRSSGHVF